MKTRLICLILACGLSWSGCAQSEQETPLAAEEVIGKMLAAHGGMAAWEALPTFYVERVHTSIYGSDSRENTVLFSITADNRSGRIYQDWQSAGPNGEPAQLVWDGERAWSVNFAFPLPPRFVMSSGYYVASMPWLMQQEGVLVEAPVHKKGLYPGDTKSYITLKVHYEPDVVRKPKGVAGPRDHFVLYLNPESYLIEGINMFRSYAGFLNKVGVPGEVQGVGHIFAIRSHTTADGLVVPSTYELFSEGGERSAYGAFKAWSFRKPFDEQRMVLPAEAELDQSSSYLRN